MALGLRQRIIIKRIIIEMGRGIDRIRGRGVLDEMALPISTSYLYSIIMVSSNLLHAQLLHHIKALSDH